MRIDSDALAQAADEASEFLKSLANPIRLRILCMIADREVSVGELVESLKARQSVISQHLTLLRKDGLVRTRREGQTIRYALADDRVIGAMRYLQAAFCPGEASGPAAASQRHCK
jgi:DNA-binding transcriptional ArsR family regulator